MSKADTILLSHGSGGRMMDDLIRSIFLKHFGNDASNGNADSAILELSGNKIAFTTDSYVVDPIVFPGGDIGKIAVCGTVNDLAVSGAEPKYLSCSFILEEGLPLSLLESIVASMAAEAEKAGVRIVTGDTKVVNKGKADKIFINTTGIGRIIPGCEHLARGSEIEAGDILIINGYLGDHGIAVMAAREELNFDTPVFSDCAPLNGMIADMIRSGVRMKFMRDATRGGLASVLCEIAELSGKGLKINEESIPVREEVQGACEIFGFDPLYIANEGKALFILDPRDRELALACLRAHTHGKDAAVIGTVTTEHERKVVLLTAIGGKRIIDKLAGEQLPRIC